MKRQLGSNERIVYMNTQAGSISFVVISHVAMDLDENHVRKALDILCTCHPLIQTRIEIQDNLPFFISDNVPSIPLRVLSRRDDSHWIEEAEHEINTPLPSETGPMIRVVLLTSSRTTDVLIRFHHVIGDGMSGMYLMRDLLTLCEKISQGKKPCMASLPERPPIEELLPPGARGFSDLIKTTSLIGKQLYNITVHRPKKIPCDGESSRPSVTHIIHHCFSAETTWLLVEKCHTSAATVHGAVCAALLTAAAHRIQKEHAHSDSCTVGCMSAVDMRQFLYPPVGEEVGLYASMVITSHKISPHTAFWDLSQEVTESVHHSISKGEPFVFISLLDKLVPRNADPADVAKRASDIYPAALLVTNLGRLTIDNLCDLPPCRALHFAVSNKAVPNLYNAALLTFKNQLIINFSYNCPLISEKHARALATDAITILQSAVQDEKSIH